MRITKSEIRHHVDLLAKITGEDFSLDIAYGGYKLVAEGGSRNISARMTGREIYNSIRTALNVLDHLERCEGDNDE